MEKYINTYWKSQRGTTFSCLKIIKVSNCESVNKGRWSCFANANVYKVEVEKIDVVKLSNNQGEIYDENGGGYPNTDSHFIDTLSIVKLPPKNQIYSLIDMNLPSQKNRQYFTLQSSTGLEFYTMISNVNELLYTLPDSYNPAAKV